ncbi:MAG: dihydrofolate reductase [Woeseiaceae bacterium]|nr:dihydrofolate reductase [Woeseiaceae bacterium]
MSVRVSIIVAAAANNVIGLRGELPWRLPDDLRRFKRLTMGKPIVMGRLTHESIGRALPGRRNIVISRQPRYEAPGCDVVATPTAALALAKDDAEIMVIGGGRIYSQLLGQTDRIYLTRVHATPEGDAFFPELDDKDWRVAELEECPATEEGAPSHTYEVLERVARRVG